MQRYRRSGIALCWRLATIAFPLLAGACSTTALHQARAEFYSGNTPAALARLPSSDVVASKDRLLYWLEKGLFLHVSGDYEASNREFLAAARYLDENDFFSISSESRAVVANDWARNYTGEYSERLWIHSYLMMNFLSLGEFDSAAVEARRALERISEFEGTLERDDFTRALIALSFEAAGQLNDAYIEYSKLSEGIGGSSMLDPLLLSQARRLGFSNDAREISNRLQDSGLSPQDLAATDRAAVVFISSGLIPGKSSGSIFTGGTTRISFPRYDVSPAAAPGLHAEIDNRPCDCPRVSSDLGQLVSDSLNQRAARLTARSLVRAVSKDAIADAISDKDKVAGEIARLLLFALEEADVRSWRSLPRHLTMLRVPLPEDNTTVTLSSSDAVGQYTSKTLQDSNNGHRFRFHHIHLQTR